MSLFGSNRIDSHHQELDKEAIIKGRLAMQSFLDEAHEANDPNVHSLATKHAKGSRDRLNSLFS